MATEKTAKKKKAAPKPPVAFVVALHRFDGHVSDACDALQFITELSDAAIKVAVKKIRQYDGEDTTDYVVLQPVKVVKVPMDTTEIKDIKGLKGVPVESLS
jgi:hypothetical protein